jgi:glucose-6-phosphate isomerase
MIKVDLSRAIKYVDSDKLIEAKALSLASFKKVQQQNGLGAEWLGWRTLLAEPNDALLEEIDHLAATIRKDAEVFIVVGIGGSYLGAKAVIDMLKPSFSSKGTQILYAGHQISGSQLSALVDYISMPKADGSTKSVYVNIISKSGTTSCVPCFKRMDG